MLPGYIVTKQVATYSVAVRMTKNQKKGYTKSNAALFISVSLLFIAFAMALALGLMEYRSKRFYAEKVDSISAKPVTDIQGSKPSVSIHDNKGERPKQKKILVFIIDDAGHNLWQLEPFLKFPGPLSISVLPSLPYSKKAAEMIKSAGKELMLHQPMEAIGELDPGPGAIWSGMDDETIRKTIRSNLTEVNGALGINNHMGSKASADTRIMSTVLDETEKLGLYFLDSLTTSDSVVHSVASLMRQSTWERSVFLDNNPDKASIQHFVVEGSKIAEKRGYAIMIGHVWSSELAQTLTDLYPVLIEQGFSLSTISKIMMDSYDDDSFGD